MPTRKWGSEKIVAAATGDLRFSDVAALTGGGYVVVWVDSSGEAAIKGQRFDDAGTKVGAEFEIGSSYAEPLADPAVTGLADGGFYVTFTRELGLNNNIEGEVYGANGAFVRSQSAITATGLDGGSDVAALGTGSVVVWQDPNGDFDAFNSIKSSDILIRRFDAAGAGSAVTTANLIDIDEFGGPNDSQPSVAASSAGITVVWRQVPFAALEGKIVGRIFDPTGTAITGNFILNAIDIGDQSRPVVSWLAGGTIAVAWNDGSAQAPDLDAAIRMRLFSATGVALTGDILVNDTITGPQVNPVITALPGGGCVVTWSDGSGVAPDQDDGIRLQAFTASGAKIGGEIVVNTGTANIQTEPSIAALADGRIVVTWTDFSGPSAVIRSQIVDPRDGIVNGGGGNDKLYGHDAVGDEINGAGGADTIYGLKGNDIVYGGDSSDIADGGNGDDTLYGGGDNDTLTGGLGDDDLFGEDGNDTLRGGQGGDLLDGGAGTADLADYLTVTSGGVTAALDASLAGTGEALGDTFAGVERLRGTNFGDMLRGDTQANILFGQNGADTMDGRAGADRLIGGLGVDTLTGGAQADRFEFASLAEIGDIITDFTAVDDTIVVTGTAFGGGLVAGTLGAALFQSSATNVAANATIRFIFENDVKIIWFDADGNGAGAAVMVADLQASATMTNADILIV